MTAPGTYPRRRANFNSALLASILLWALGSWFVFSSSAQFELGGDTESVHAHDGVIHVRAYGLDAVAIGLVFFGLGFINLAIGVGGSLRIPIFWVGAGLFGAAVLYGLVKAGIAVVELAYEIAA